MNEEPQSKRRRQGRPTAQITLSDDERQTLERWARRRTSSQALALRCRIVLARAQGLSNVDASARLGVHATTVGRIWRAFGLKPHLAETWKLSSDPQFTCKVRDLCGLYLNPPEAAVVLCVDEQSQIQALDRTAPVLPLMPGSPQRRSHDYTRHGTINLYAALNLASGLVISQMTPQHRTIEFQRFLDRVDQAVPAG